MKSPEDVKTRAEKCRKRLLSCPQPGMEPDDFEQRTAEAIGDLLTLQEQTEESVWAFAEDKLCNMPDFPVGGGGCEGCPYYRETFKEGIEPLVCCVQMTLRGEWPP